MTERVRLFRLALPEAAAVAEHFESALSRAESSLMEAQAAAGRAIAAAIYKRLTAQESLRTAQAAAGRTLASAICQRLIESNA